MPSDPSSQDRTQRTAAVSRRAVFQDGAYVPSSPYGNADGRDGGQAEPATRRLGRSTAPAGESPERTLLRPVFQAPRPQPAPAQRPYVAAPAARAAVPSPQREAGDGAPSRRGRGPLSSAAGFLARLALRVLAFACRLAALALSALVVADALVVGSYRVYLLELTARVSGLLPSALSGTLLFETPLGGVLRLDFAIAAVVLFVLDWLLTRASRR